MIIIKFMMSMVSSILCSCTTGSKDNALISVMKMMGLYRIVYYVSLYPDTL